LDRFVYEDRELISLPIKLSLGIITLINLNQKGLFMKKFTTIFLLLLFIGGGVFVYFSPQFERISPKIDVADVIDWNIKEPIAIVVKDDTALKSFELIMSDGKTQVLLSQGGFAPNSHNENINASYPKGALDPEAKHLKLKIIIQDRSYWNFFRGNETTKVIDINVDTKRPHVELLANSYSITQGGSALVVFRASDENLKDVYVDIGTKKFKAIPYKKEGYYTALIAWPFLEKDFSAHIVALDKAKNVSQVHVPLYIKSKQYAVSWIRASDSFIDGKITELVSQSQEADTITDKFDLFRFVNEKMRIANEQLIAQKTSGVSQEIITKWDIKPFYPLKNGAKVASFGDTRHYYYDPETKEEISLSYHVGIDLASIKNSPIVSTNGGRVVFAANNGIYGNMPVIDHGMGLYTIYGHCNEMLVDDGKEIHADDVIATTGMSGLALGDHLHFGVLVQGVEVRPEEWMDENWIKLNIDEIFIKAGVQ
jgi:murein DD-endopeptidase MepM/ murein hydrolase activator NlpD